MDNVKGALQRWYHFNAFEKGFFGSKPRKRWSWPTMEELMQETGLDEDGIRADIEEWNDCCDRQIFVIRNGKVGYVENPTIKDSNGHEFHNPNSGF